VGGRRSPRSRSCRAPQRHRPVWWGISLSLAHALALAPYTLHPTSYTIHLTHCTLHPTPYTLHFSPCTLHPTPCTLHPTPCTLHQTLHPKPHTIHLTYTPSTLHPLSGTLARAHTRFESEPLTRRVPSPEAVATFDSG
jgi:hypothetical protein